MHAGSVVGFLYSDISLAQEILLWNVLCEVCELVLSLFTVWYFQVYCIENPLVRERENYGLNLLTNATLSGMEDPCKGCKPIVTVPVFTWRYQTSTSTSIPSGEFLLCYRKNYEWKEGEERLLYGAPSARYRVKAWFESIRQYQHLLQFFDCLAFHVDSVDLTKLVTNVQHIYTQANVTFAKNSAFKLTAEGVNCKTADIDNRL